MSGARDKICELHRLEDAAVLGDVARALEVHGIESDLWAVRGRRLAPWAAEKWRLMVLCRDLVYARWIAAAAGLDTWPDEDEAGGV